MHCFAKMSYCCMNWNALASSPALLSEDVLIPDASPQSVTLPVYLFTWNLESKAHISSNGCGCKEERYSIPPLIRLTAAKPPNPGWLLFCTTLLPLPSAVQCNNETVSKLEHLDKNEGSRKLSRKRSGQASANTTEYHELDAKFLLQTEKGLLWSPLMSCVNNRLAMSDSNQDNSRIKWAKSQAVTGARREQTWQKQKEIRSS